MLDLARNTFTVYYKLYLGQVENIDANGYKTGTFSPYYGELQSAKLSVSSNRGETAAEPFGTQIDYDRTMSTADVSCPINEEAILWLDGISTAGPNNYIVKRRAPWKNSIAFAIKEVDTNE